MPASNVGSMFSGPSVIPPRWAKTSGRVESKNFTRVAYDRIHVMASYQSVSTLGALRKAVAAGEIPRRSVHEEVRENLISKLRVGEQLFPGIVGYDDTVIPQLINALLSRHNFILLGLRG